MKFDDRQLFTLEQMAKSYIDVSTHIDNSVFQGSIATFTNDFLGVYIYTQPIMSQLIMGIELMMKLLHYKSGGCKIAGHQIAPIYNKLNENVRNLVEQAYTDTINEVFYTDTNETPAMNPTLQDGKYVTKTHDGRYVISVDMDNMPLITEFTNLHAKTIDITPKFIFQLDNDFKNIETFIKILDNVKMYDRYNFFEDMPLEKYLVIRPSSKLLRTFISKIFALIENNNEPEKINNMKSKDNNQENNEQNDQEQKLLAETFNQITKKIETYRYNIMTYIYPENNNYRIYLAFFETTDNMPDIPTMLNMSEKDILDNFTKFIRSYQNEAEAKTFVDGMMHIIRNPLAPPDLGFIHTIINSLENN